LIVRGLSAPASGPATATSWWAAHTLRNGKDGASVTILYRLSCIARLGSCCTTAWLLFATTTVLSAQQAVETSVRSVSHHPQLFLDDDLVAEIKNLRRDMKQPVKHPANPLIQQDYPWERRMINFYGNVLFNPDTGKFQCWYLGSESPHASPEYYVCYAESDDGLRWTKPLIGEGAIGAHTRHNIVLPGGHGWCVLRTPDDPRPEMKYKAVGGDLIGWSRDGIRWTTRKCRDAVGKNDTCPSFVHWNGDYLWFVRQQEPETGSSIFDERTGKTWSGVMRGVGLCVSQDFQTWSIKRSIFRTDEQDGFPWHQPHALCVTAYGDILIGLLPVMHIIPEAGNNMMGGLDVQLLASRNGREWHRVADRAVFMPQDSIEPVKRRRWDANLHPGSAMLIKDDVVHIYYVGTKLIFGEGPWRAGKLRFGGLGGPASPVELEDPNPREFGIGLATLPADRFVSFRPQNWLAEGTLTTRPFHFSGQDLLINADVEPDDLRVEILDEQGHVVPGFGHAQSQVSPHDRLRYRVRWQDKSLADLRANVPIALRIIIRDGDLYAFQVTQ
jgi:hypothetical protein